MMAQLIRDKAMDLPPEKPSIDLKITPQKKDPKAEPWKRPDQTIPERMPETEIDFPAPTGPGENTAPRPGKVEIDPTPPGPNPLVSPIIRIPPPYPENCRSRGVEGVVIVEFDVSPEGNVVNPRVVQSAHGCFNRTVLKTVSGWKYPPAGNGGMRYGVIEHFNFQLEG